MSIMQNVQRNKVPEDLRHILLEFTIGFLLEQPEDIIDFGVEFFLNLQKVRRSQIVHSSLELSDEIEDDEEDDEPAPRGPYRRHTVFAETYDPEDSDSGESDDVLFPKTDDQRKRLLDSIRGILLFRGLDDEQMNKVLDAMFEKVVSAGEYVIHQGDDGDNFYVIERGIFNAFVAPTPSDKPELIKTYENAGSFGELALMYNVPRAATVQAVTDGQLWAMDRLTFRKILLKGAFKKRQIYEQLIETVPMLKELTPYERMDVADALIAKTFEDGECIVREGDTADGMYLIEYGTVQITVTGNKGHQVEIKTLEEGMYFGELALLTNKPRAASAFAVGRVKCAFLDVEAFERLLGPCMEIMRRNIVDYEHQLVDAFGTLGQITDVR